MANETQAFWLRRAEEARQHAQSCDLRETTVPLGNPCAHYVQVEATALDGQPLRARIVRPAGEGPHPVLMLFHDANRPVRGWHHMTRFVALGLAVVALESRAGVSAVLADEPLAVGDGLGVAMRIPTCDEPPAMGRELSDEATAALEGTLSDALLLAALLPRLEGLDASRVVTWGEGLGGGLALSVASLVQAEAAMALNPLPAVLDAHSALLDVALLAQGYAGRVLLGTGALDLQASPQAQKAIAEGLATVRHISYPRYGHERVNAFEDEQFSFLVALLEGRS